MPTYATPAELNTLVSSVRIAELSADEENGQALDSVINLHLDNAEGEVNAALSKGGYAVPVVLPLPAGAELVKAATLWLGL